MTRRRSARLADERGFALVTVLAVMAVVVLFSVGAFAAVNGDLPGSGEDVTSKQAMAAAEAGVADYLYRLNNDSAYWTKCTAAGPGLNDPWTGTTPPSGTSWRTVPGATTRYAIELLPARNSGYTKCDPADDKVVDSMLDPATRSLRIRVTGEARGSKGVERRSVIANVRRTNFLDYLWFTDYETSDRVWWQRTAAGHTTVGTGSLGDLPTWGANNCARYYRAAPTGAGSAGYDRPNQNWSGWIDFDDDGRVDSGESITGLSCSYQDIQFASDDELLGPMHTNDEFMTCDGFTMGDSSDDRIESGRSWRACDGRSSTKPNIVGTLIENAQTLKLPPTDAALGTVASSAYTFTGRTTIVLNSNSTITVTNANVNGGAAKTMAYPTNGVIYVKNGTCGYSYQPLNPYNQTGTAWNATNNVPAGCGQAWVSGTYNKDLTIATQDDLVVSDDIIRLATSDARLGLIADNFVRVYHPVDRKSDPTDCNEPSSAKINNRRIDAAILSLVHSFMVDNYYCGDTIGTLTVNGVIAQKFRGAVGTGNGSGTGFLKNYTYDTRLAFKGPPHFLDPVQSAWRVIGYTEQQPAQ
jgi:hypothetical protein